MQFLPQSNRFSWDFDVALLKLNETIVGDVAVATIPDTKVAVKACRSAGKNGFVFLKSLLLLLPLLLKRLPQYIVIPMD